MARVSAVVTVAIPSYNHAPFVLQAIDSVVAQTNTEWQLRIIDDGSTDDSAAVIDRHVRTLANPRISFSVRANRGLSATLNEALAATTTPLFCYLGSDDWWAPTKLARQLAILGEQAACYSDCYVMRDGREAGRFSDWSPYRAGYIYRDIVYALYMPPSPTNLFRADAVRAVGGFDEKLFLEDRDLWLRLTRVHPVAYVPEPLAYYRVHEKNVSTQNVERMYAAFEYSLDKLLREDPTLRPLETTLRARNLSRLAADEYNRGNYRGAIRVAARAVRRSPFEKLAWGVGARSVAKSALSLLRSRR